MLVYQRVATKNPLKYHMRELYIESSGNSGNVRNNTQQNLFQVWDVLLYLHMHAMPH